MADDWKSFTAAVIAFLTRWLDAYGRGAKSYRLRGMIWTWRERRALRRARRHPDYAYCFWLRRRAIL